MTKSLKSLGLSLFVSAAVFAAGDATVLSIGKQKVKLSELNDIVKEQTRGQQDFESLDENYKKMLLTNLISQKLLVKKAFDSGVKREAEYKKLLSRAKEQIALKVWLDKQKETVKINDKTIKAYYDDNKAQYKTEAQVKASHILVKTEDEAKAIIADLKKAAKAKITETFAKLAQEKSTGPSGKNGGDLGFFNAGQMVKPFSDEAFSLAVNSFSQKPVKTQFGYHIVLVTDKKAASSKSFAEVQGDIKQRLTAEAFKKNIDDSLAKLKKSSKIKYAKAYKNLEDKKTK